MALNKIWGRRGKEGGALVTTKIRGIIAQYTKNFNNYFLEANLTFFEHSFFCLFIFGGIWGFVFSWGNSLPSILCSIYSHSVTLVEIFLLWYTKKNQLLPFFHQNSILKTFLSHVHKVSKKKFRGQITKRYFFHGVS